jgi:flagellar protein FlaG
VVKVVDNDTKEVIRQIPSEEMLKIAKYIDEITGLLFKDMA